VLISCVDGLKGFPEAIEAVYPHAWVQICIVHYADVRVMPIRRGKAARVAGRILVMSA
jgi:transposase-like protein